MWADWCSAGWAEWLELRRKRLLSTLSPALCVSLSVSRLHLLRSLVSRDVSHAMGVSLTVISAILGRIPGLCIL